MKRPRPPLLFALALLVATVLLLALAPVLIGAGVRAWIWWAARQEGVDVQVAAINAPLLRPVVLNGIRVHTPAGAALAVELEIARAEFRLNLASLVNRARGRHLRDLAIDGMRVDVRQRGVPLPAPAQANWKPLRRLFADTFRVSHLDLRIQTESTRIEARNISLSASEVESGALNISEIAIASPLFSKRFANLRGATSWQNQRLTLGAIELTRGIDIDAFTIDFSHLALRRIGLEANVDVFGGKVRANLSTEDRAGRHLWDVAGTAADVSLAQMSQMLGWRNPAAGALRACKFTFRGDTGDLMRSTASIWTELNGFHCAGKAADTIMLGASLYNRRLHLEQLYVKQQHNQLTLSGDAPLTLSAEDWAKPDLNADLSATITDLDGLAQLFGAHPGEYAGEIVLEGTLGMEDRKLRGGLTAAGEVQMVNARLLGNSRATAELSCTGSAASIAYANVVRGAARLSVWGDLDFSNLRAVRAQLFPLERLVDLTAAPSGSCVSMVALAPAAANATPPNEISAINLRGGLFAGAWSISLASCDPAAPEQQTTRTFQLCPATSAAATLTLAAGAGPGQ